jgi:signal transduction histidine kinase
MAKLETQRVQVVLKSFSPALVLEQVMNDIASQATSKGLALTRLVSSDMADTVIGDPQLISQIMNNLLTNAIKFTQQGLVKVEIGRRDSTQWYFSVTDSGVGIPPDRLEAIFEPFQQADTSSKRIFGGTGLGLAIAHHNARLMGGNIEVESQVGLGSTFTVILPIVATRPGQTRG